MEKFALNDVQEQETHFLIDYYEGQVKLYTTRKQVYERLLKKIGEPTITDKIKNEIVSATWVIPFSDKVKISKTLSRPLLIGNLRRISQNPISEE